MAKAEYAKTNPDVKINIVEYAQADIIQKLNTGLNSGTTKGLPNIVLIEDYRSQSFLQSYKDSFYDLSSSIKGTDFADYKSGPTSLDGKQYGVPLTPALPASISEPTIWSRQATSWPICRISTGSNILKSAKL